jgi:hypothetical protein
MWEVMSGPVETRKRIFIWALVKFLLTVCDHQNDASAAISFDQPLKSTVAQVAREAVNAQALRASGNIRK